MNSNILKSKRLQSEMIADQVLNYLAIGGRIHDLPPQLRQRRFKRVSTGLPKFKRPYLPKVIKARHKAVSGQIDGDLP